MYARQITSEETYTLSEVRHIIIKEKERERECFLRKVKQKMFGLLAIGIAITEEYFDTKEEMDERYFDLFEYELCSLNPTAWELVDEEWKRLGGY